MDQPDVGESSSIFGRAADDVAECAPDRTCDLAWNILEHVHSAIAVFDAHLDYIYVNQRYLGERGLACHEVIGRNLCEVLPGECQQTRSRYERALGGEVLGGEKDPWQAEDGTVHWLRWECRPWYTPQGIIGGVIAFAEVVDEQKHAEDRLIQYQRRLRALAAELVLSAEREQRQLGTYLHDGVGQLLVAAKMEAQMLRGDVPDGDASVRLDRLIGLVSDSIDEVRSLTAQLVPSVLVGRGLPESLRWLSDRFRELHGLVCVTRVDQSVESTGIDTKMLVFRVVREALNNVVRHSGSDQAVITVRHLPNHVSVSVVDKGVGFDSAGEDDPVTSRRFGLFSINEECLARGGSLKVWSRPGKGTRVTARIPDSLHIVSLD